jgi:hypothetical protein
MLNTEYNAHLMNLIKSYKNYLQSEDIDVNLGFEKSLTVLQKMLERDKKLTGFLENLKTTKYHNLKRNSYKRLYDIFKLFVKE